ncbi:hypothetical protein J4455_02545 [Candidatus Woesearchaeota archaeon]|nr:hypothetical protein [Candidatus Woesearchaeota archaeon]
MPLKEVDSLWKISKYNELFILSLAIFFLFILYISFPNDYNLNKITGFASISNYSNGGCSDLDNDRRVSIRDLNILQENIGKSAGDNDFNEQLDFDKNNIINQADLICLQSDFGKQIKCPQDTKLCGCLQGCYDLNKDEEVSVLDLAILSKKSGQCVNDPNYDPNADFDGNGCISSQQLSHDYLCLYNNIGKKDIKCGYDNKIGGCSDFDNDGLVSNKDYNEITKLRGSQINNENYNPKADYNYDGRIDDLDLACFNEDEGYNIKCPQDSRYCGCFNGCADLDGDGIVSIKDLNQFNEIAGSCKGDPNYNENVDFDKDNCVETNKKELDFLCINYNMGKKVYCNIKPLIEPLKIKDIKYATLKISLKTNTKINFKNINNEQLGSLNLNNGVYNDGVKSTTENSIYLEITGDVPDIKEGIIKVNSDNSEVNLYIPNIEETPKVLFFNKNGESYYDVKLKEQAANINSKYISTKKEINFSPLKCNELKCIITQIIQDYYIHLLIIIAIIIVTHLIHKKKSL